MALFCLYHHSSNFCSSSKLGSESGKLLSEKLVRDKMMKLY